MSKLDRFSRQYLAKVVSNSFSVNEVLGRLNYKNMTTGYLKLKEIIKKYKIDTSHFKSVSAKKHFTEWLVLGNKKLFSAVKKKIINELLGNKCSKCPVENIWQGSPISLHLDHINGNPFDNRIENLRVLCPNCHSQTSNFGSKNGSKKKEQKNLCQSCNCVVLKNKNKCRKCSIIEQKKERDLRIEKVLPLIGQETNRELAKKARVSNKYFIKRCKELGLKTPNRRHWDKNLNTKNKLSNHFINKPKLGIRKYNYQDLYDEYLKTKSYAKVGRKFSLDKSVVRQIIKRHIKYLKYK